MVEKETSMDILQVIVGSKLQGLDSADSDTDIKGVWLAPVIDVFSPFTPVSNAKPGTDKDTTLYELMHFCALAAQCNPTALEVLFSDMPVYVHPLGEELRANADKFIFGQKAPSTFLGYARQQAKFLNYRIDDSREAFAAKLLSFGNTKPLVHRLRILEQGIALATRGEFKLRSDYSPFLYKLKFDPDLETVIQALELCEDFTALLQAVRPNTCYQGKVDRQWIDRFCQRAYLTQIGPCS